MKPGFPSAGIDCRKMLGFVSCLMAVALCGLLASCTSLDGESLLPEDHNLLSLTFEYEDPTDAYYSSFEHTVRSYENGFSLHLDRGRRLEKTTATVRLDQYGQQQIHTQRGRGECVVYSSTLLFDHDVYGDDPVRWIAVIGARGSLRDSLLRGGKGCYAILQFDGSVPPDGMLFVKDFDAVRTRREGNRLIFEMSFQNRSEGSCFPQGKGRLVGTLEY